MTSRREFLATGTAAAAATLVAPASAQWQPSPRYPDPSIKIVDPSFAKYRVNSAKVERLGTGYRWCEGPVWFGDGRYLLWSDIPNDRMRTAPQPALHVREHVALLALREHAGRAGRLSRGGDHGADAGPRPQGPLLGWRVGRGD